MHRKTKHKMGARMIANFNRTALAAIAALALGAWTPQLASASLIGESEPNDTGATAQTISNAAFDLGLDANITSSTTIPHVSVRATGDAGGTYDFYRFTSNGGTIILDIDLTPTGGIGTDHDTEIGIWDAAGNLIASNDDFPVDLGSVAGAGCVSGGGCNSFIQLAGQLAGDYVVGVCRFNCNFGINFGISGNALSGQGFYTLHISTEPGSVPAPEPSTMFLLASGLLGLGAYRRRNAKKS